MYITNSEIKKELLARGFHNLYLFPHLRFMKDYIFEDVGFDAIGWKKGGVMVCLFQFKTNEKPSKKMLEKFKEIESKYAVKCYWATKIKRKGVFLYGTDAR